MSPLDLALGSELSVWGDLGATADEAAARLDVAEQALEGYIGRLEQHAATLNEQGRARLAKAREMLAELSR
jgi:hypothetical protein